VPRACSASTRRRGAATIFEAAASPAPLVALGMNREARKDAASHSGRPLSLYLIIVVEPPRDLAHARVAPAVAGLVADVGVHGPTPQESLADHSSLLQHARRR
jgi:hypothetical protein